MKFSNSALFLKIITFLLLVLITIYSYLHIFTDNYFSDYSYSELFINYQAGLIRRGLLGEIYWQYNKLIKTDPKIFFGLIFYFLYLFQIILL